MLRGRLTPTAKRYRPDFGLAQVNIVLLLVLFYLVVGTIVDSNELTVELPETLDLPLERLPRPLLLLGDAGEWSLDGESLNRADALIQIAALPEDKPLHLLAARDLPAETLMETIESLRPTGRALLLVTLKSDPQG